VNPWRTRRCNRGLSGEKFAKFAEPLFFKQKTQGENNEEENEKRSHRDKKNLQG
jgi:hypothetical protein